MCTCKVLIIPRTCTHTCTPSTYSHVVLAHSSFYLIFLLFAFLIIVFIACCVLVFDSASLLILFILATFVPLYSETLSFIFESISFLHRLFAPLISLISSLIVLWRVEVLSCQILYWDTLNMSKHVCISCWQFVT